MSDPLTRTKNHPELRSNVQRSNVLKISTDHGPGPFWGQGIAKDHLQVLVCEIHPKRDDGRHTRFLRVIQLDPIEFGSHNNY